MYSVDIGPIVGGGQCWVNVIDGGPALDLLCHVSWLRVWGCVWWGNTGSWVQLVKTGGGIFRSPFSLIRV